MTSGQAIVMAVVTNVLTGVPKYQLETHPISLIHLHGKTLTTPDSDQEMNFQVFPILLPISIARDLLALGLIPSN
jgi:hypothetical protein